MRNKYILFLFLFLFLFLCLPTFFANQNSYFSGYPDIRIGKDYALFFAINEYDHLNELQKPIENAEAIAEELKNNFGFHTEIVENATYDDIEEKLNDYKDNFAKNANGQYDSNGQLLIFFSGHGVEENENGFFLPKDAKPGKYHRTSIGYEYWREYFNGIDCKHILIAIDACFSVNFDPSWRNRPGLNINKRPGELSEGEKLWGNHHKYKTRIFFTADAKADETPDRSTFAKKFLEGLKSGGGDDGVLTSSELFTFIESASPKPHRGDFGDDEAGSSFLFKFERNNDLLKQDINAWKIADQASSVSAYLEYIQKFPNGEFKELALKKIKEIDNSSSGNKEELLWGMVMELDSRKAFENYLMQYPNGKYSELAKEKVRILSENELQNIKEVGRKLDKTDPMVFVKGGHFTMGCTFEQSKFCKADEKPSHKVNLNDFFIKRYEVTNKEYCEFLNERGNEVEEGESWLDISSSSCLIYKKDFHFFPKDGKENHPVVEVTWFGARAYCKWLSQKIGREHRLPTEAEWEFAARGGQFSNGYLYSGSNNIKEVAWFSENSEGHPHMVGQKEPNELGLFDMSGNVWEWCLDNKREYLSKIPKKNPKGSKPKFNAVIRGGSWYLDSSFQRVSKRGKTSTSQPHFSTGFRYVRSI